MRFNFNHTTTPVSRHACCLLLDLCVAWLTELSLSLSREIEQNIDRLVSVARLGSRIGTGRNVQDPGRLRTECCTFATDDGIVSLDRSRSARESTLHMAAERKLKAEIDRTLKKVIEGQELFEDLWNQVHACHASGSLHACRAQRTPNSGP